MSLGNILLGLAVQAILEYINVDLLKRQRLLRITSALPYPWDMVKGIGSAIILKEILIYYPHRHIHNTPQSPLRKYHTHPTPTTSSLNLTSTTPIDYLLLQFIPVFLPSVMLSFHLLTYLAFVAITSLVDAVCYSQYDYIPKALFVGRIAKRMRGHYKSGGSGGYGWIGMLDWWHGTEVGYNKGGVMGVGGGGEGGEGFTDAVKKGVKKRKSARRKRDLASEDE
ncbi:hypothetical protein ABW21_db0200766 [Orbilia brochopaga]|nr:hypothetical protein ABW21_db0200766 [Drechslerella brochopaga]